MTESYKYLMTNKDLYDNIVRQSDIAHFRERIVELSEKEDEIVKEEEWWIFKCRQCHYKIKVEMPDSHLKDEDGMPIEGYTERLCECSGCSLVYAITPEFIRENL